MKTLIGLLAPVLALTLAGAPLPANAQTANLPTASLTAATQLPAAAVIDSDFADGTTQGWGVRETEGDGTTVTAVTVESLDQHAPSGVVENHPQGATYAIAVTGRDNQGDGAIYDAREALTPGEKYQFSAYALFLDGNRGALTLSSQTDGDTFTNLIEFPDISFGEWTHITGTFTMPLFDNVAYLYLETPWQGGAAGNTDSFALANIVIEAPDNIAEVGNLPSLRETMPNMNTGMAIDSRETTGAAAELIRQQFNQVVAENHMKPEAWFDGVWNFERIGAGSQNMRMHHQARSIIQFAADNNMDLFGHVLVWHSQIPDWFFQETPGGNLLSGEAGRDELLRRMDNYIYNVAKLISDEFGPFGSPTNPVTAYEVVNEVVSNSNFDPDGLRQSNWARIIGSDFIDEAFRSADRYFNHEFAAPGVQRPVSLWINDYNTEVLGKRLRYLELVNRLLERGVPIDGVGQQFHVQMATPVANIAEALDDFGPLPVRQSVTEFDITMSQPGAGEAQFEAQGHRVFEIFNVFREHQARFNDLDFVTVWGLTDARSWRGDLAPTLFFGNLEPKPAFWGAIGDLAALGALRSEAIAFGGGFDAARIGDTAAFDDVAWQSLPAQELTDAAGDFQIRHNNQGVTILANLAAPADTMAVHYNGNDYTVSWDNGTDQLVTSPEGSDVAAHTNQTADGHTQVMLFIGDTTIADGGTAALDVRALQGNTDLGGWNSPGTMGEITFVEPLSFTQAVEADRAPAFGAAMDPIWNDGVAIRTGLTQDGAEDGATAIVHTLWHDDTLYVRFDVTDPTIDVSASDPWEQDSVEVFLDLGNAKNGGYRTWHDMQVRVSADGVVTFGEGEPGRQQQRVTETSVARTDTGYVVELAIGLWTINEHQSRVDYGGVGAFQGFDVQVNDATGGHRTSVHSWANPTPDGFQDTSRWGVIELVNEASPAGMTPVPMPNVNGGRVSSNFPLLPILIGIPALTALGVAFWATRRRTTTSADALPDTDVAPEQTIIEP